MDYSLKVPEELAVRVDVEAMKATVADIFQSIGASEADARRSAEVLMYADLRGIDTHGVSNMMPHYVRWIRKGFVNPAPVMRVVREAPAMATVDADRGLGLTIGPRAMRMAMEKADACGIGSVVVANGRHFGAASYYAAMALERDMIGVAMTTGGVHMAPTFGATPMLGANPLALAAPSGVEPPFVFDASASSVAMNRIILAQRLGAEIPPGWITDECGTPIMESGSVPRKFLLAPVGGTREIGSHKGYGVSVAIDILCGLLGAHCAGFTRKLGEASHHFVAYRIDAFTEVETFKKEMDTYLKRLRECKPAPGEERVLYAGLPEHEAELDRRERGIPYHPDVVDWHRKMAVELGIDHRLD